MTNRQELFDEQASEEDKQLKTQMEYYLGLELLWILTNISAGPDEVVNELLYDAPASDLEKRMT